jgi:type I site-specific restriction endonuclease
LAGGVKTPEQEARDIIDQQLLQAGWLIQNRDEINLSAGRGIAIREFKMADGYGFADYNLYLDKQAIGALEAKPAGFTLSGVKPQIDKYSEGLPPNLLAPIRPPTIFVCQQRDRDEFRQSARSTSAQPTRLQLSPSRHNRRMATVAECGAAQRASTHRDQ